MMRRTNNRAGFAMLLVMLAIAMAAALGLSYLSSASVKRVSSENLVQAGRAKYLAESGLQHAMYLLRKDLSPLDSNSANPLGPFFIEDGADGYTLYAQETNVRNLYVVTAEGRAGELRQKSSAHVYRAAGPELVLPQGLFLTSGSAVLPPTVTVNGDLHVNGSLVNLAYVTGDVTATGTITDSMLRVTGAVTPGADSETAPTVAGASYGSYRFDGTDYTSVTTQMDVLAAADALTNGGSIGAGNPGGVVKIRAQTGTTVSLPSGLHFQGTLVVTGNVSLDGSDIRLRAVDGFPALVVTGKVYVTNNTRATIDGLVVANKGIVASGDTANSQTEINGGLLCNETLYDSTLGGQHVLNYVADRCRVYDVADHTGQPWVRVMTWND